MKAKDKKIESKSCNDEYVYLDENHLNKKSAENQENHKYEMNSERKKDASKPLYLLRYE